MHYGNFFECGEKRGRKWGEEVGYEEKSRKEEEKGRESSHYGEEEDDSSHSHDGAAK